MPDNQAPAKASILSPRNIIAGVSVGAYMIPQAMAYGSLAGVSPSLSLSIAVVPLVAYMIFGRNPYMSLGPESAVALMAAAAVGPVASAYAIPWNTALAITGVLVGLILGIGWLLRASFLADLLSYPILTGYLTGVAVLMIMSQLPKIVNYGLNTDSVSELFRSQWQRPDWQTVALATIVVVLSFALNRISKRVPGPLVGLIVATIVGLFMDVPRVGTVSLELPVPELEGLSLEVIAALLVPALSIAVVSFTDVMITSRAFAGKTRPDSATEMRALAAAQLATGAVGGYPMSASSSRTALAFASGSTTRFYSLFVVAVLIAGPLLIPGVIAEVPIAALAGVIVYAALTLVRPAEWAALLRFRISEFAIAAACAVSVVLFGILTGVIIAIALSIAEFMARLARPHDGVLGFVPNYAGMHDVDDYDTTTTIPGLVAFRYDAPLFFMNAYDFYYKVTGALEPDTEVVILNMEANVELDTTALNVLEELHDTLAADCIDLWLARVKNDVLTPMQDHGVSAVVGEDNMYPTMGEAVQRYRETHLAG
ncbi:MAG: SulP family inorganic anion transporter [Actinobacteria bacterium]|nr:SulP family inorganic anion transporter [Actinomycetota bacterium]MCB8996622.1 SulP family inorganic anion transporter [Actinomycetota bacterium]MCB9415065.1 SulP family inorganic anion transporter [Actinomycetota bacterium]HPJ19935.1 SulP family inorganic anion transporter [Actinomycetota bacterium]HRY10778.1 SulP family inorganic anion transporter [Candidatus Nanopelagicales bacterium]